VRNRYFDLLRAVAIVRVVIYHATGWALLTVVFPAMGTMFALAGSLMAASLDRYGARAVGRRMRRLLPPVWLIAAIFVLSGLSLDWRLLLWAAPVTDPPSVGQGAMMLSIIWYVRVYLWFVLLSPVALPLFRRWPLPMLALPLAVLIATEAGAPLGVLHDFGVYFGCWLLGFAHRDGLLKRVNRWLLVGAAATLAAAGLAWFLTHPSHRGYDLNDIPIGDALWSTGFVLILVGLAPTNLAWLDRRRLTARFVTVLNSRAVTIYLWHQAVIVGLGTVAGLLGWQLVGAGWRMAWLLSVGTGVALATVVFGWVEDLAAKRRLSLVPGGTGAPVPRQRAAPTLAEAVT
jgi:peptidoglycan/LPS O-acetylase OafA/YrhL